MADIQELQEISWDAIMVDLEEIKKLPPKERLKRLVELKKEQEEERKKKEEVAKRLEEEAKKLLELSLEEIKTQEMLEQIEVPKGEVKLEELFRDDEQELEQKVKKEAPKTRSKEETNQYDSRSQGEQYRQQYTPMDEAKEAQERITQSYSRHKDQTQEDTGKKMRKQMGYEH